MNHLQRHPTLLAGLLLLGGCQLMPTQQTAPGSANPNILSSARQLEAKGRYGQAISLLENAIVVDGKAESYTTALREIRLRQNLVEQELADQLLISKTSALRNQMPILEQLARSNPDESDYVRQMEETQKELLRLSQDLSECGWRHFKRNNALAKDCLTLSLSLHPNEQDERLMQHLLAEQHQDREKTESEQRAQREMAWKRRNQTRLDEATRLNESGQLTEARRVLKILLKEDPKNETALSLLSNVESRLKSYLENLLNAGDRLYREGEIEGAKATWRAALTLDPQDTRAREKIERAQRVLDNLENLRRSDAQKQ